MALQSTLQAIGQPTRELTFPDGSRLLLLPAGARVLGLFGPNDNQNFFWTNPDLEVQTKAEELFASTGWRNTGGDRTWLAPEIDFFFPGFPDDQTHVEPPELDAATYEIREESGDIGMVRRMSLQYTRRQQPIDMELSKWLSPADNPFREDRESEDLLERITFAGYTQRTCLTLIGPVARDPVPVGIWNLIQLPLGGEMLVATHTATQPRIWFGVIPPDHLRSEPHCLRWRTDLPGEHKIGVRALPLTGRVGYRWHSGDHVSLVVRNFFVNPAGHYVDAPFQDPADTGYGVQMVNVDSKLGQFCELEYHTPAIGTQPNRLSGEDVSQVWAFRGEQAAIDRIVERLLGISI